MKGGQVLRAGMIRRTFVVTRECDMVEVACKLLLTASYFVRSLLRNPSYFITHSGNLYHALTMFACKTFEPRTYGRLRTSKRCSLK